ncbi:MAG TPA: hypothetical protein VN372_02700 [Methanospirillum sp.]|nr:hypothetical protein [Methanospirillum sp.]
MKEIGRVALDTNAVIAYREGNKEVFTLGLKLTLSSFQSRYWENSSMGL